MRALGIVPARAGSKRLVDKNLRTVGGESLVSRAIGTAVQARSLSRVIVSSDDDRVLDIASSFGPAIALRRPAELAADTSPAIDYVRHALAAVESGEHFEAVAIVQPTSPFTSADDIDATLAILAATAADSAVTVVELEHAIHPLKLKRMGPDGQLEPYLEDERGRMAAHQLPQLYVRNGSVYASRRSLIDSGRILGDDCRGHVMPRTRSIDINDELDLAFAEFLCASST